jgi:amidophosphoribosyltransferase
LPSETFKKMSDPIKHECGIAFIRLRKPLEYYEKKYGDAQYGLNKLYLLMEKQHNRGQEAAGVGVVKLTAKAGEEYIFRDRRTGAGAIKEIFGHIAESPDLHNGWAQAQLLMGHLRYSTTGKKGLPHVHPMLRRDNWRSKNLLLEGNFNLTNNDELFQHLVDSGQHPRRYGDTFFLLESIGHHLSHEVQQRYNELCGKGLKGEALSGEIESRIDLASILRKTSPQWDGGFTICGATGSGSAFVIRDAFGSRPCFYYSDDESIVVASERPVIQTVMSAEASIVQELQPGEAMIVKPNGTFSVEQILQPLEKRACSFERIYFSRGSDTDIYRERKKLGELLVPSVLKSVEGDLENTVLSFIPNTAEVAYFGMLEGLQKHLAELQKQLLLAAPKVDEALLQRVMSMRIRPEKVAIKDIKLRTFIEENNSRNDLAAHVYDITYGSIRAGDNLVILDDSIVRGTTLMQSVLKIMDRLQPKKIVVVSSSPQVRYPDCYGIDMSQMNEFAAFRATVELLKESKQECIIHEVYKKIKAQENLPKEKMVNHVKEIYAPFTNEQISAKMAEMLTPQDTRARVELVYQTIEGLHLACPEHTGDWYFSGNYPTAGGVKFVCQAYASWYENL